MSNQCLQLSKFRFSASIEKIWQTIVSSYIFNYGKHIYELEYDRRWGKFTIYYEPEGQKSYSDISRMTSDLSLNEAEMGLLMKFLEEPDLYIARENTLASYSDDCDISNLEPEDALFLMGLNLEIVANSSSLDYLKYELFDRGISSNLEEIKSDIEAKGEVQLAILKDSSDSTVGFALVYKTEQGYFYDSIYTQNDSLQIKSYMRAYLDLQGIYPRHQSVHKILRYHRASEPNEGLIERANRDIELGF